MATVVSVPEIRKRLETLGWTNLVLQDVLDFLRTQSIPAVSLIAYLDAAIATPAGFDDQTIVGCDGPTATKLTNGLKAKGFEAV
jgi:hypothetical protein